MFSGRDGCFRSRPAQARQAQAISAVLRAQAVRSHICCGMARECHLHLFHVRVFILLPYLLNGTSVWEIPFFGVVNPGEA